MQSTRGGDSTIEAPTANVFAVENLFKGSVAGFGVDGSGNGWASESVEGSVSFTEDTVALQNAAAPAGATDTWYSNAATQLDNSVTIEDRFISSFVYQNDGFDANLSFVLASVDTNVATLAQAGKTIVPNTFTLVIDDDAIDAAYGGQFKSTPVPDQFGISSGDPIEVLLIYEFLTRTASVTLTNAGTSLTFDLPALDLVKVLGTNQAKVGFVAHGDGLDSIQNVSAFSFFIRCSNDRNQPIVNHFRRANRGLSKSDLDSCSWRASG